jgi:tetratricopeptide (TPR) repeat protein
LAVELAAARVAVLHPDDLLTRLEHSLPVLTSGARDAPGRQRTLRATLDWSYDLLDDEEKGDFARLAVFEGGFDAESAVAVAGVSLDALQSLIEKSLVRLWGAGRFGMLETLHEYAVERFTQLLDHDEVRRLHAEYYLARAPAETDFLDDGAGIWLDFLETERENFRGALAWSASSGRLDLTCRLAACFAPYWGTRGSSTEALTWMEATLDARESLAPEHRARYLRWAAYVAFLNGGLDRAWPLAEEALALSRLSVDARGEGSALLAMATYVYDAGQLDDAARLLEEAADAFRRLGTGWGLPAVAINLGNIAVVRGDYERAEQAYTEALVAYRALNSPRNVMVTLANLANLCVERGVPHEAVEPFREAFEIAANDEDRHALAHVVNIYSRIALAEGSWRRAAVLIGSRDHLVEETGERFLRDDERIAARERDIVQAALGEAAFSEAWAEGAALELGALVSFVRETLAKTEFGPRGRAPTT